MALAPKEYRALINALANIDLDDTEINKHEHERIVAISALVEVYRSQAMLARKTVRWVIRLAAEQEERLLYAG